jgi:hypothetical protein
MRYGKKIISTLNYRNLALTGQDYCMLKKQFTRTTESSSTSTIHGFVTLKRKEAGWMNSDKY